MNNRRRKMCQGNVVRYDTYTSAVVGLKMEEPRR